MLNIKTIKTVIISTIGMLSLSGCSLFCGPNMSDVKVMKPMAQKISDYIVKNGIPESLKDIPDLPYGLEGCKHIEKNFEECSFFRNNKKYEVEIYILGGVDITVSSLETETGLRHELKRSSLGYQWLKDVAYSSKDSGICSTGRM